MASAEMIIFGFDPSKELRHPAPLPDRVEILAPTGQHLVRIALMSDVQNQAVMRRVEDVVERRDQLDGAEAGGEMSASTRDAREDLIANLIGDLLDVSARQFPKVGGSFDPVE